VRFGYMQPFVTNEVRITGITGQKPAWQCRRVPSTAPPFEVNNLDVPRGASPSREERRLPIRQCPAAGDDRIRVDLV